jgi:hypothetical protein
MRFMKPRHLLTGVSVPVSALRTSAGCGTGEFADLIPLGEWCARVGLDLIQILPVNDTGWNTSPYSALSAFALHPLYLRLSGIPGAERFAPEIEAFREAASSARRLSYRDTLAFKLSIVERIFAATLIEVVESQAPVVCVDNTNLTRAERQPLVEVARLAHREPIAHVMPFEPLDVVYARKQEALRALARDPSGVKVNGFPCDRYEAIYRRYEEVCEDEGFVRILHEAIPLALRRETRRARRRT